MKEGLRSVFAALGVSAGCLFILLGANVRDRFDSGSSGLTASTQNGVLGSLVASRDNQSVIPAADYYSQMVALLKQYYVEPIKDDEKLADGSVRGMISSLNDPYSLFMDAADFRAYIDREKGRYEGIGVELALDQQNPPKALVAASEKHPDLNVAQVQPQDAEEAVAIMSRFPSVKVVAVVPGGPADKAGVKVGDIVADVDGHWVVEDTLLQRFKNARDAFNAKKITFDQIEPLQKELRDKTQRALLPVRVLPKLMVGTSGAVKVTWKRNGTEIHTTIQKGASEMPPFEAGSTVKLPMSDAGAKALKGALQGKDSIQIDLRNEPVGSYAAMIACLDLLAPNGRYGEIVNRRAEEPTPLSVQNGNPKPPKIRLLVDPTTRGPAAILALALSGKGRATLTGTLGVSQVPVLQDVELPDGSGYDLWVGVYHQSSGRSDGTKQASGRSKMAMSSTPKGVDKNVIADRRLMAKSLSGAPDPRSPEIGGATN